MNVTNQRISRQGQEWVKLYFHFPIRLHGSPEIPIHRIIKSEISNRAVYNELISIT